MAHPSALLSPEVGMISPRTRARMVQRLQAEGIDDARVLAAMGRVPRHRFVAQALAGRAYEPVSLPIGYGQTISQPWTVARMTAAAAAAEPLQRVLEVGTGSAYQTAILAALADEVYSIERIEPLLLRAREKLAQLGVGNVHLRHGDGAAGWAEAGPFDAIVITAAAPWSLPALFAQLRPDGRLVMPVADGRGQRLHDLRWDGHTAHERDLGPCHFVPLLAGTVAVASGDHGW
ncbi:MAG: protein-L-isoaspartate(D-aspartate) O-methyltransferase [Acidithiobacillus sp.]|uniref:protein-L-isoaspartate(D-aspartate) O-methyltransferase n=1 Tax=Acidithiobacillus sp. TaxID=1872118 RepID=UPI003D08C3BF